MNEREREEGRRRGEGVVRGGKLERNRERREREGRGEEEDHESIMSTVWARSAMVSSRIQFSASYRFSPKLGFFCGGVEKEDPYQNHGAVTLACSVLTRNILEHKIPAWASHLKGDWQFGGEQQQCGTILKGYKLEMSG